MTSNSAVDCYDTAQTDVITQNCDEDINRNSNNVSFSCDFAGTTEINNQAESVENDVIKVGQACTTDVSSTAAVTSRDIDAVSDDNDNNIVDTTQLVDKQQVPAVSELSTRDNDVTTAASAISTSKLSGWCAGVTTRWLLRSLMMKPWKQKISTNLHQL